MQILTDKIVTAKKAHKCFYCGFEISKGEKYNYKTIADNGSVDTFKTHVECEQLCYELDLYQSEDGVSPDDFKDAVIEHHETHVAKKYQFKDFKDMLEMTIVMKKVNRICKEDVKLSEITPEQHKEIRIDSYDYLIK